MKPNFLLTFLFSLCCLILLSHTISAQQLYQRWVSFADGSLGELEFRQDSSMLLIRSLEDLAPRIYRGEVRKFRFEILNQDSQEIRLLLQEYPRETYSLMLLFDQRPGQMRMYFHRQLESPSQARLIAPPPGWGVRLYTEARVKQILNAKKPGQMPEEDFIRILKVSQAAVLPLIPDSIPPAYTLLRPLYLGARFYEAIVDQGYNIFEKEEGMDQVLEKYREAPEVKPLFRETFSLILGKKLD